MTGKKKAPLVRVTHSKTVEVESVVGYSTGTRLTYKVKRERYWLECKHYIDLKLSARRPQRMRCYECKNSLVAA